MYWKNGQEEGFSVRRIVNNSVLLDQNCIAGNGEIWWWRGSQRPCEAIWVLEIKVNQW